LKVIILAGGLGTRLTEETIVKPKPMVEIGGYPILWHIMKIYSAYGIKEFIPTLGYKGEIIKNYFLDYQNTQTNISVDVSTGEIKRYDSHDENWIVHLLDTGAKTETGGRIKRGMQFAGRERIMATYGDGLGNINISELLEFHKSHGKLATLTAVRPPSRFGEVNFKGDQVVDFIEKSQVGEGWINGGFFVLEPKVKDYIEGDDTPFESYPLKTLSEEGQLMAYRHDGFWQPMDVIREKQLLEKLWQSGKAPWKVWD
jgi:glucose-1-phosphate cytidylyltransferase|tara:strand:- start:652 stop:1422 length:771 start_codon:yes stop_codon:yes gene_type:complete